MKLFLTIVAALLLGATSIALAEPIKLIIPTAPGGGTDGFFRVLAKEATSYIKDPIVVVNVPGAGGTIGVAQMVHSPPDGQTACSGMSEPSRARDRRPFNSSSPSCRPRIRSGSRFSSPS